MRIIVNGTPRDVHDRLTVAQLLAKLELASQQVAVEVNRELVPRGRHESRFLGADDHVEIVTLVGGG